MLRINNIGDLCKASLSGIGALAQMEEYFIIDSVGRKTLLGGARFQEDVHLLGRVWDWLASPLRPVVFDQVTAAGTISVGDLRGLVLKDFQEYPTFWGGLDMDYIKAELDRATAHSEIIALF